MPIHALLLLGCLAAADTSAHGMIQDETIGVRGAGVYAQSVNAVGTTRGLQENPDYFQALGEAYVRSGRLPEAFSALKRSSELQNDGNPETLKRIAGVGEWIRKYKESEQWLERSLALSPDDGEALEALSNLRLRRSLHIMGSVGGTEPDYVRSAYETRLFLGWLDWLDLYGGYSAVDRVSYRRTDGWADAYFFPDYRFYVRLGLRTKHYVYPVSPTSTPDQSAYNVVPSIQVEGTYPFGIGNSASLEVEYFRPTFYWDTGKKANNFKVTASLQHQLIRPLYGRFFVALLKDPESSSFVSDPTDNSIRSFGYETLTLVGGAVGLDAGRLNTEITYIPDRDLDRSIAWSVLGKIRYTFGGFGVQYDLVYDRYAIGAGRGFISSRVNMITFLVSPTPVMDIGLGAKLLSRESIQIAPFLNVLVRTGM